MGTPLIVMQASWQLARLARVSSPRLSTVGGERQLTRAPTLQETPAPVLLKSPESLAGKLWCNEPRFVLPLSRINLEALLVTYKSA